MTQFTPLYAILIFGCIVLSGAVIYRYLYSGWTRIRTALRLGMAGGGIGYAIVAANAFEVPQIVANIILLFAAITFIAEGVYTLYAHLRVDSTAEEG